MLSKLPIGDLATQYFADHNLFCAGRVNSEVNKIISLFFNFYFKYKDLMRVAKATGGIVQTTVNGLTPDVLGSCGTFEEVQLGAERFNLFKNCPKVYHLSIK